MRSRNHVTYAYKIQGFANFCRKKKHSKVPRSYTLGTDDGILRCLIDPSPRFRVNRDEWYLMCRARTNSHISSCLIVFRYTYSSINSILDTQRYSIVWYSNTSIVPIEIPSKVAQNHSHDHTEATHINDLVLLRENCSRLPNNNDIVENIQK